MDESDEPIFGLEFNVSENVSSTKNKFLAKQIQQLVAGQSFCVLCTQGNNQPYGSLIAYAFTDDMKKFYFTTPVATRKFKLLIECSRVALLIDSRSQHVDDMMQVAAVTITGNATRIENGDEYTYGINLLKNRHSYLRSIIKSDATALFRIDVVRYFHVTHFQEVTQWIP